MLNLTRLHLGIAHESQFQGLGITYVKELFDELETAGVIARNGEMRRGFSGEMQPVYILTPRYANDPGAVNKVLQQLTYLDEDERRDVITCFSVGEA